ncbi:zinc finger protein 576-like [Myiozetetes cayanensis]|uniref:zinc finger protein 576-like n=1 Tax=Myiozetetes cayanensis TaxID=478635 RepID=UPI00215FBFD1|nr:zinc finger protein 576-like [Myiozetetes cayanensis]
MTKTPPPAVPRCGRGLSDRKQTRKRFRVAPEAGSRRRGSAGGERPPGCQPQAPGPRRRQQQEEEEEEEEGGRDPRDPQPRAEGSVYKVGSRHCGHCLITFPDAAFAARHAKRQHPRDFAAAALRGALFVCFVCARPFGSSPALLRHQRGHAPHRDTPKGHAPRPATPPPGLACTECGRAFAREGALHRHYIRHARGEL